MWVVFVSGFCFCKVLWCLGPRAWNYKQTEPRQKRKLHREGPDTKGISQTGPRTHIECSHRRPRPETSLYEQGPDTKGVYTIWAKTPHEFSHTRPRQKETYHNKAQTKKEPTQASPRRRRNLQREPGTHGIYTTKAQTKNKSTQTCIHSLGPGPSLCRCPLCWAH